MNKPRVLVTRAVFDEVLDFLRERFDVQDNQGDEPMSPQALAAALADKDGVMLTIADRVDEALLAQCPRLKAVCNIAVGYNNIDVAACTARGVMVTNTPGVLEDATADFTWALILAAARRVVEADAYVRGGQWKRWELKQLMGTDVHHATLGIVGMGRIGQQVARRARGFDMTVLYHNRRRASFDVEGDANAEFVGKEELLQRADFVVLTVPYTQETHHLIGEAELALMRRSAILVNTSRGGVVDDAALVRALKEGRIAGAGLDVFEGEPAINPEFLGMPNVVLAPHIASSSRATRFAMAMKAAENLRAALTSGSPPNLVNPR